MQTGIEDFLRALATKAASGEELMQEAVRLLRSQRERYDWVGIYLIKGEALELGPYVGKPTPHTRIRLDQGICGAAASRGETLIVPDVHADPRYLACSLETRSEIVVPIKKGGAVVGEIDVDSNTPDAFDEEDRELLETVAEIVAERL